MSTLVQISVLPRQQEDTSFILELALQKAKLHGIDIKDWRIRKRSIDARRVPIKINLQDNLFAGDFFTFTKRCKLKKKLFNDAMGIVFALSDIALKNNRLLE